MVKKIDLTQDQYHKTVYDTWSNRKYEKYKNSQWRWADLPFRDYITNGNYLFKEYLNQNVHKKIENKSILEIGSAMGSAYGFLQKSGLVDLSKFTGVEVSKVGIEYCKKKYPRGNWLNEDFTMLKNIQVFDYSFERNAIHHMPNPLKAYEKVFKSTRIAFSTCFRSCLMGKTISNLELSNFKTLTGIYYSSIINLFDLTELALKNGFRNIKITFGGAHEIISNDPKSDHYISPQINQKQIFLSRCKLFMIKTESKKPIISFISRPDVLIKNLSAIILIINKLNKIKEKFYS